MKSPVIVYVLSFQIRRFCDINRHIHTPVLGAVWGRVTFSVEKESIKKKKPDKESTPIPDQPSSIDPLHSECEWRVSLFLPAGN